MRFATNTTFITHADALHAKMNATTRPEEAIEDLRTDAAELRVLQESLRVDREAHEAPPEL